MQGGTKLSLPWVTPVVQDFRVISRPVEASGHPVSRGDVDLVPGLPLVNTTDPSVMQRRMYVL